MTTPEFQYNQNIPKVNDDLATSQGGFLSNFQQLYLAFAKNHVALDGGSTAGNHTIVELMNSGGGFQTDAGELSLNARPVQDQTGQLFMRYQSNSKNTQDVQYTNYQIYYQGAIQHGQHGFFTTLPGGIIVYFGSVNFTATNEGGTLYLNPFITKELLSVNFCASGTTPTQAPSFTTLAERPGLVTTIVPQANTFSPNVIYYYLIVGKT